MLRISLIIAIIAGIAALTISQLKVAEKIKTLNSDLDSTRQNLTTAQEAERKAKKEAKDATAAADTAKKELDTTKNDLAAASEKADTQEKRANDLATRLEKTTLDKNDAQSKLATWQALGRSIDELKAMMVDNKKLVAENDALKGENKVLGRNLLQVRSELDILQGTKDKVELPASLKGKVIAVDPKYEFVVLDIGADDGVLARGEMLVNRSGKLVAKVRILTAEPHRSVANVLGDWKQGEIMEGDIVLVGL
jgi:myosin heavy subunit